MAKTINVDSRYSVAGHVSGACNGCDGMGFYPTRDREEWHRAISLPEPSGEVFVSCTCTAGQRVARKQG